MRGIVVYRGRVYVMVDLFCFSFNVCCIENVLVVEIVVAVILLGIV
jgi:hypothetical protein